MLHFITERKELTPKERYVYTLLLEGKSSEQIASELGVTPRTLKAYISKILIYYNCENRTQLLANYIKELEWKLKQYT